MSKGFADFSTGISEFSVSEHCRETADSVREVVNLKLLIYAHSWAPTVGGVEATTRNPGRRASKMVRQRGLPFNKGYRRDLNRRRRHE